MLFKNGVKLVILVGAASLFSACSANKAQSDFRQEALAPPNGITEMTVHGTPVEDGQKDPTDWRTAPEFIGLLQVETPAFPNPVYYNGALKINLYLTGNAFSELYAYVFRSQTNSLLGPIDVGISGSIAGLITLTLSPAQFLQAGLGGGQLYRILIFNAHNQIVTYGDVKIK